MKTSLLMKIFNTCRVFSRYGTTTYLYFLTQNNKLSNDSQHPEQSLNKNSPFTQKLHIYLEILRTTTDISLFALRRHCYLALILFTRNVESIVVVNIRGVSFFYKVFWFLYISYTRNVKSIAVVINNVESIVVIYTQRKYFVQRSVALVLFISNVERSQLL